MPRRRSGTVRTEARDAGVPGVRRENRRDREDIGERRVRAPGVSPLAGVTESAHSPGSGTEGLHHLEPGPHDRYQNELCNPFTGGDGKRLPTPVPTGDHDFPLIVGINETDQISEHDPVTVPEPGPGQHQSGELGISDMERDPGAYELGLSGGQGEGLVQQGPQVHPRRSGRGRSGQGQLPSQTRIKYAQPNGLHDSALPPG